MSDTQQVTSYATSAEEEYVQDLQYIHSLLDNQSNQDSISQAIGNHYTSSTPFGGKLGSRCSNPAGMKAVREQLYNSHSTLGPGILPLNYPALHAHRMHQTCDVPGGNRDSCCAHQEEAANHNPLDPAHRQCDAIREVDQSTNYSSYQDEGCATEYGS